LRFDPEALDRMGVHGAMVGELSRNGAVETGGRTVRLQEVTFQRPGNIFAFVMDTRPCKGALELARDADLLLMEATYSSEHQELAELYLHSTAEEAAKTAREAGARQLALTHFSQRYPDASRHLADSRKIFQNTIALSDFDRVEIKRRRS
jgi:ribonuclease Z